MSILNTIKNIIRPATTQAAPFTDRASYRAWRAQWKADYKALSSEITEMKRTLRRGPALSTEHMSSLQSQHHYAALRATEMLSDLAEAKIEAARQYTAQREEAHAA